MNRTVALILAGGEHPALSVLTAERAEAAVPFAGKYRIIDFTLSNCINSGITNVGVLTQYRPRSLQEHIGVGKPWDLDRRIGGVHILHPYLGKQGSSWQRGNADALRANLDFIAEQQEELVLVLAGDHVYKMDYRPMVQAHIASQCDVTVAVHPVAAHEVQRFGIVTLNDRGMVSHFAEKPSKSVSTLASMGIYLFRKSYLLDMLARHDGENIGRDIMPVIINETPVNSYTFPGYWADVGTLQAYYDASMALLSSQPALDLSDPNWVIHTKSAEMPAAEVGPSAHIRNSLICDGSRVYGNVSGSVIGPGVVVPAGCNVIDSILLPGVQLGTHSHIERTIIDKEAHVGDGANIGRKQHGTINQRFPTLLNTGLTVIGMHSVIPAQSQIGTNVLIAPRITTQHWTTTHLNDGETLGISQTP
ncbi:MAG: glucose-1-phosphate adenylyltransferase family protein [Roseiflexaceae bacterium]|jgi:glucose-1-phosphate adenylyltransferase